MKQYLNDSEYIDWKHPAVLKKAAEIAVSCVSKEEIAKRCFIFVRDSIKHSWDYRLNPVTCKASEVLMYGTGYCYSKSHLLASLLRANGIPSGLCYQRLSIETEGPPFCLHGLNAVFIEPYGSYRIDARGNKTGVSADFCPPQEKLAFQTAGAEECDIPGIWAEPMDAVVKVLTEYNTIDLVYRNLPDVTLNDAKNLNIIKKG